MGNSLEADVIGRYWQWLRRRVVLLALRHPLAVTTLLFLLLFTVSNHVHYATQAYVQLSPFWHMIAMGTVMGFFGALLMYGYIQQQRRLAQVELVRSVVTTLHHEINNPLTVIYASAALLHSTATDDPATLEDILKSSSRIREVMAKLGQLEERVNLRAERGFEGAIDLVASR